MGKKKKTPADAPEPAEARQENADPADSEQDSPEVRAAARAVEDAKAALRDARACYEEVRKEAVDKVAKAREARLGDVIDGVLAFVRKHPGPGVLVALLAGFFLGRKFRW